MSESLKDVLRDPGTLVRRGGSGRANVQTRRRLGSESLTTQLAAHIDNEPEQPSTYPDFSLLDNPELAGEVGQVVLADITGGRLHSRTFSPAYQQGVRAAIDWLLNGPDPHSFGIQQFPGSSAEDAAAKTAALVEFADRLFDQRGPRNG